MRAFVAGAAGQLGSALARTCPPDVHWMGVDRTELDIGDRVRVLDAVRAARPDLVVNAAAYTAVDRAESERELAYRVNAEGAAHLAEAADAVAARFVHVSTDYVFDGRKSSPYLPDDAPNPLSVYGASKLAGERAVLARGGERVLIVRTQWVYAAHGTNFLQTLLRLLPQRSELRVVADQVGTPTHVDGLAHTLWAAVRAGITGVHHWSDAGVASWYDFACAIRRHLAQQRPDVPLARIVPIATAEYVTPARRPAYGVLDKTSLWNRLGPAGHWEAPIPDTVRAALGGR